MHSGMVPQHVRPGHQGTMMKLGSPVLAESWHTDLGRSNSHAALSSSMQRLDDALTSVAEAMQPDDLD